LHAAPAKALEGDEIEVDGTNFNPGSGRGKYVRRGGVWTFVGDETQTVINGGLTITGGGITLSGGGSIKGGQTAFDTGTGFFLGYSGATYKFSIGNSAGSKLTWNGTALGIVGDITGTSSIDITGTANFGGAITYGGATYAGTFNQSGASTHGAVGITNTALGFGLKGIGGSGGGGGVLGAAQAASAVGVLGTSSSATGKGGSFQNSGGGTALEVIGAMTIDNTTEVTNLNADLLDGNHAAAFATAGHNHAGTYETVANVAKALTYVTAAAGKTATGQYAQLTSVDGTVTGWVALYS
jgi:hypothetical protein